MNARLVVLMLFFFVALPSSPVLAENSNTKSFPSLLQNIQDDIAAGEKKEGYKYYREEYRKYETLWWYKIASWMVEDSVERQYINKKPVKQILDLGCGFGTLLSYSSIIYGAQGVCIDVNNYLFPNFQKKYRLKYIKGDIERGTLPGKGKFDIIIMTEVLEHLNFHPVPTLKKIHKTLAPGGSFFLSTPDAEAGWGRVYKYYKKLSDIPPVDQKAKWIDAHIWQYNETELKQVVREAGFKIKRIDHTYVPAEGGRLGHFNVWLTK